MGFNCLCIHESAPLLQKSGALKLEKRLKVTVFRSVVNVQHSNTEPLEEYIILSCIFTSTKMGVIKHWNRLPRGNLGPLNLTGQDLEQPGLGALQLPLL